MVITSRQIFQFLYILSWIIFIGVCIEAGGFIFNTIYDLAINPAGAKYYWEHLDLSELYSYDRGHFATVTCLMCLVAVLRAVLFYLIIKILHDRKFTLVNPFNHYVLRFLLRAVYITLLIGLFSFYAVKYDEWLQGKGVSMPDIHYLRIGGGDVWLFMSVTLFVLAQVFKKGIEIQTENDLTI